MLPEHTARRLLDAHLLDTLRKVQRTRHRHQGTTPKVVDGVTVVEAGVPVSEIQWIANERRALHGAAQRWLVDNYPTATPLTEGEVARAEVSAIGHADYSAKYALYVTDAALRHAYPARR